MEEFVGRTLGSFEVGELIGQGGMAAVYKGRQPSMNRDVAIKIMFPQLGSDESFVKRFRNEAQVIAQLEHAHILPVIDFGDEQGVLFIVMRYLDAGTLKERIPQNGMEVTEAHRLFVQIASALEYAHSKNVVHRDLKPANIMVDEQGNTFLTDFGIAKMLERDEQLTGTGGIIGTPSYMSPEQGMAMEIDHRSDIYSLGVLLFEMLTGQLPFSGGNPMAVMLMHMNAEPPTPSSIKPGLHKALDKVILKAIEKDPNDRYQSAGEMIQALDEAVAIATGITPQSIRAVGAAARAAAAAAAAESATLPMGAAAGASTVAGGVATQAATLHVEPVTITPTIVTSWVQARGTALGVWLRAFALSAATFIILQRLLPGSVLQSGLLSIIPGLLLYGLLRAPTLGAITAFVLILLALLVQAPGLGIIWAIVFVIAAARLHSQEMLLTLAAMSLAGIPFVNLVVPLITPWWLRARRTVLPMALGVGLAILFASTLGWPTGGGLLPAIYPGDAARNLIVVTDARGFLDLFDPGVWPTAEQVGRSLPAALEAVGASVASTSSPALLIMASWALASVLSVSNRRVQSAWLRASGIGAGALLLLAVHLLVSLRGSGTLDAPITIFFIVDAALMTYVLTQWPLQVDPNTGNLPTTVQRMLRQTLGALFLSLGLVAIARDLPANMFYNFMLLVGATGVLWMLVNPLFGGLLAFITLVVVSLPLSLTLAPFNVELASDNPQPAIVAFVLLSAFILLNLVFDRRRPRRWNPIGTGAILGAPVLGSLGLLALPALSMGLLEAQVPAAIFAVAVHLSLWFRGDAPGGAGAVFQLVGIIVAILLPQRLMDTPILKSLHSKARRLIFAVGTMVVVFPAYYLAGGVTLADGLSFPLLFGFNLLAAALLVLAMGDAATVWVSAADMEDREEEEIDPDTVA